METMKENEIVLYQPDETVRLEVRIENETVWLNQAQMAVLFGTKRQAITKHIKNIFECGELQKEATCSILELVRLEGSRNVTRQIEFYNLDVIISVGYRINTVSGIHFRQLATTVLKEHLLKGFSVNARLIQMEDRIDRRLSAHDQILKSHEEKIDFFIRTNLPPVEGVLFEGQVLDARLFAENLIKTAQHEVILIDNYIDASDFDILECRSVGVEATIFVERITPTLLVLQTDCLVQTDRKTELRTTRTRVHDRFLIIDSQVYHLGASLKDLGKKLFAFSRMGLDKDLLLGQVI
jgi:hypothetical protein